MQLAKQRYLLAVANGEAKKPLQQRRATQGTKRVATFPSFSVRADMAGEATGDGAMGYFLTPAARPPQM
jgi:hypothetical protein